MSLALHLPYVSARNSSRNYHFWKFLFYMFLNFSRTAWSLFNSLSFSFPLRRKQSLSQNIQTSDGVHSQHKQMNILQTRTANGGALQVIQAQTVQKSSSRRSITSTSYSSQFSSNLPNDFGHAVFSPGHRMNGDLLVRLISMCSWLVDWSPFVSIAHTHLDYSQLIVYRPTIIASPWSSSTLEGLTLIVTITSRTRYFISSNHRQHLPSQKSFISSCE